MRKTILIILIGLLTMFSARAYDFEVGGIYYNRIFGADQVEVTFKECCDGSYSGSVVIPASVTYEGVTYVVSSIGNMAFAYCGNLRSVMIPESVITIKERAFQDCNNLTSVAISRNVTTIEYGAFSGCRSLVSVTIPESTATIGGCAFKDCDNLTSVTIPLNVITVGNGAFSGCRGLVSVEWNASNCQDFEPDGFLNSVTSGFTSVTSIIFGNDVTHIPAYLCFCCRELTSVTIPDGVVSIGEGAFYNCSGLEFVIIPESVVSVSEDAFTGTSIRNPLFNSKVFAYMPVDYNGAYAIPLGIQSISSKAFFQCVGLSSVMIPESVTSIGRSAFAGCEGLMSVAIPDGVAGVESYTFINCRSLVSVEIPNTVTAIGEYAFCGCSSLMSVTIPNSCVSIEHRAFMDCSGLETLSIGEGITSIGDRAFSGCSSLRTVEWNAKKCRNFTDSYDGRPFDGSLAFTSIIFGNNVSHIPSYLCYKCDGLKSVIIPDSVISVGASAFRGCCGLTSVVIGEEVTSIGANAFYCENLTSVEWNAKHCNDFPDSDTGPFNSLETPGSVSIMFGDKVEHIPAYLFGGGCNGLTSVTLGKSVGSIGQAAFDKCNNLRTVYSKAKNPPICYYGDVMADVFSVHETLYVPRGSKASYQKAIEWRKFYEIEEIGEAYTLKIHVNDETMGTVIGGGTYDLDEQVTLVAIPNQGYYFVRWDDGSTDNPRILTVEGDITLTAVFAKNGDTPSDPADSTANEAALMAAAAPFAYVQGRTAYLADGLGEVEAFTATGQRVSRGFDRTIELPRPGVYVLRVVADGRRSKVVVR